MEVQSGPYLSVCISGMVGDRLKGSSGAVYKHQLNSKFLKFQVGWTCLQRENQTVKEAPPPTNGVNIRMGDDIK